MQVQSLGQEDTYEEEMATHFCVLAQRIPWTEEPSGLQSMGSQKSYTGHPAKMAGEQDGETTFSPTNSSKEQLNAEQISQNNF